MGLIFIHIVPIKVAKKRKRLTPNCQGLISGEEKFSTSQSRSVAAAREADDGRAKAHEDATDGWGTHILHKHAADEDHQNETRQDEGKGGRGATKHGHHPFEARVVGAA